MQDVAQRYHRNFERTLTEANHVRTLRPPPPATPETATYIKDKHRSRLKLKGIDGRAPPGEASVALFDTTREKLTRSRHSKDGQIDSSFLIGAWPLFVGGVIGLVDSVNGRDHCLLNNVKYVSFLNTSFRDALCPTQGSLRRKQVCGSVKNKTSRT